MIPYEYFSELIHSLWEIIIYCLPKLTICVQILAEVVWKNMNPSLVPQNMSKENKFGSLDLMSHQSNRRTTLTLKPTLWGLASRLWITVAWQYKKEKKRADCSFNLAMILSRKRQLDERRGMTWLIVTFL